MGQLHARMGEDIKLKGLSPSTRRNYLLYCHKFPAHKRRSLEESSEAEIRAFL